MKNNQNGFSLIELMAVLVLSSVVLVPLLISFTNSLVINQQSLSSRIATSVAEGALYAIEKIDFADYRTALDDSYTGGDDYLALDGDLCATAFIDATDQSICSAIFAMESASVSYPAADFKIYLFDYNFRGEYANLLNDGTLPQSVRNELSDNLDIATASADTSDNQNLIWMILWIDYYDDPDLTLVSAGIIANDDPT